MSEAEATPGACRTLRLLLGDQLNAAHPWFQEVDEDVLYVLAELRQEATYARHHVQKVAAFFAAMERFAQTLRKDGHRVLHLDLDDTAACTDLPALLTELLAETGAERFEYQRPDEHRLLSQLASFSDGLEIAGACVRSHQTTHDPPRFGAVIARASCQCWRARAGWPCRSSSSPRIR